jgi:hypothetical protein
MKIKQFLRNKRIYVWNETFAIVKAKVAMPDAFAIIHDAREITVIIDQTKVKSESVISIDKDWKILTPDMILPLELVGFLSVISKALTDRNISIFVISAYSTDHILVKGKDLREAIAALMELGCIVVDK